MMSLFPPTGRLGQLQTRSPGPSRPRLAAGQNIAVESWGHMCMRQGNIFLNVFYLFEREKEPSHLLVPVRVPRSWGVHVPRVMADSAPSRVCSSKELDQEQTWDSNPGTPRWIASILNCSVISAPHAARPQRGWSASGTCSSGFQIALYPKAVCIKCELPKGEVFSKCKPPEDTVLLT